MSVLFTHWGDFFDIALLLVAIAGALSTTGLWVRRNRTMINLARVEQERDVLQATIMQQFSRLNTVDPALFLDAVDDLMSKADFTGQEAASVAFVDEHSKALGRAAEILAEQRILESETLGKGAVDDAVRYATLGKAANPESKRLAELEKLALQRGKGIAQGEPIETLDWDGASDVDLKQLSVGLFKKRQYLLAEIAARRSTAMALVQSGKRSEAHVDAIGHHGKTLVALGVYDTAEPLCRAALEYARKTQGTKHTDFTDDLSNLAEVLQATGRYDEAEPLYREALAMIHKTQGTEHPNYVTHLNKLAGLLEATDRPS